MVDAMKAALMQDVDNKISEKVEELWQKGSRMVHQVKKRQEENTELLSGEIARCLEKQRALEQDNEQFKQALHALTCRLACLNVPGLAPPGNGAATSSSDGATTPVPSSPAPAASRTAVTPPGDRQRSAAHRSSSNHHELASPAPSYGAAAPESSAGMPELPPWPFPAGAPPSTTPVEGAPPLSLMEALGHSPLGPTPAPARQPPLALSLADSLPPSAVDVFSFTLRKADDTHLGLNVSHHEADKVLCVEGVLPEGAVDAWNRQCMNGAYPEKAIMVGDRIVRVNAVTYDPARMLEECKDKQLLRLTICRGDGPLPELPQQGSDSKPAEKPAAKLTALRAGASEFVPGAAAAAWPDAAAPPATAEGIEAASADAGDAAVPAAAAVVEEAQV